MRKIRIDISEAALILFVIVLGIVMFFITYF